MDLPTLTAWDHDAVAAFDRGPGDILVVERPPVPGLAPIVAAARVHTHRGVVTAGDADGRAAEALAALGIDCPPLAADVAAVARAFLDQFGVAQAPLRVEVISKPNCPKFHCDTLRVRLVTTYHGPGTEYVRAEAPGEVASAPTFALVFLKGHEHPGYADAVHHRSPQTAPGERRLCVVLDVPGRRPEGAV